MNFSHICSTTNHNLSYNWHSNITLLFRVMTHSERNTRDITNNLSKSVTIQSGVRITFCRPNIDVKIWKKCILYNEVIMYFSKKVTFASVSCYDLITRCFVFCFFFTVHQGKYNNKWLRLAQERTWVKINK